MLGASTGSPPGRQVTGGYYGHIADMERECTNKQDKHVTETGFIISGLGKTRHFFRLTNQPTKPSQASDGPLPLPINPTPKLDWQASVVKHSLCAILTSIVHVLTCSCPPTIQFQKGKGGVLILGGKHCDLLECVKL